MSEFKKAADDYHKHLDECEQCREHPFDQCTKGIELLQKVGKLMPADVVLQISGELR